MTEEQYLKIKPYEPYFKTAINSKYIRSMLTKDVDILVEVYHELGFRIGSKKCSGCILTMCQKLGEKYYEYEKQRQTVSEPVKRGGKKKNSTSENS